MSMPIDQSIHVHDVMAILAEKPMKQEALFGVLSETVGPDPRFHTCSLQNQSFEEMLVFLKGRGKIEEIDGVLCFVGEACGH